MKLAGDLRWLTRYRVHLLSVEYCTLPRGAVALRVTLFQASPTNALRPENERWILASMPADTDLSVPELSDMM